MNRTIAAVRNWFRLSPAGREQVQAPVPVLLASERDDDYQTLQALLHGTKWSVERSLSWSEMSSFRGCPLNPVVLVDRNFRGPDWQSTVASLLDHAPNRCVILLSDVSDPYLWNELVRQGGFDVLARPIERPELLRILAFAQRHNKGNWPSLHVPRQHQRPVGRPK